MSDFIFTVAEKVVKVIAAKVLNEEKLLNSDDIASLCASFFRRQGNPFIRYTRNKLDCMVIDTATMIESILCHSSLPKDSYEPIIICISDAIDKTDLSSRVIVKLHNDHRQVAQLLFENCTDVKNMSQSEEDIVRQCCNFVAKTIITAIAEQSQDFDLLNYEEIFKQFEVLQGTLLREMKQYIENLNTPSPTNDDFESQYLQILAHNHNHVELFTSKISNHAARGYRLDVAYIELALNSSFFPVTKRVNIEELFQYGKRWLISGEAGCGKTTLLQWLILNIADDNHRKSVPRALEGYFPVLFTLRSIKDWNHLSIRQAINNELYAYDLKAPTNLLHSLNNTGRKLLLLIDGLDEIDESKRTLVLNWIDRLIAKRDEWVVEKNNDRDRRAKQINIDSPNSKEEKNTILKERYLNEIVVVMTSRPIMDARFDDSIKMLSIKQADVLPMTNRDVSTFIDYWHNAISYGKHVDSDEIYDIAQSLKNKVNSYESVARLAQNPLLCAMICALHFNKKGILPQNRLDLYDDCCQMLLNERDQMRTIHTQKYESINSLEYEDKRRILGDLALWMLDCEGSLLIRYTDAVNHLKNKLTFMKSVRGGYSDVEAEQKARLLLDYFIERGGILRWIEEEKIGFIHKTFQEYFAAYQIYLESSWHLILSPTRATSPNWRETILLAVSLSNKESAERVISYYLKKSGNFYYRDTDKVADPEQRMIYRILAINCASGARELSPDMLRIIEEETQSIIPPSNTNHIMGLSSCGDLVVPLLEYKSEYGKGDIQGCAMVLLSVRTTHSLSQLVCYLDSKSKDVYDLLNRQWQYLSHDTLLNSNIIPAYIQAVIEHDVSVNNGTATVGKKAINYFERIAEFCTIDEDDPNAYYLSEQMNNRLRRKFSRVHSLIIENHWFDIARKHQTIIKILNLFTIAKNIKCISVTFDGDDTREQVELFCSQIKKYSKLETLKIYGLTEESKAEFSEILHQLDLKTLSLSIQHNKKSEKGPQS